MHYAKFPKIKYIFPPPLLSFSEKYVVMLLSSRWQSPLKLVFSLRLNSKEEGSSHDALLCQRMQTGTWLPAFNIFKPSCVCLTRSVTARPLLFLSVGGVSQRCLRSLKAASFLLFIGLSQVIGG